MTKEQTKEEISKYLDDFSDIEVFKVYALVRYLHECPERRQKVEDVIMSDWTVNFIESSVLKTARELKKKNPDLTMQECILAVLSYEIYVIKQRKCFQKEEGKKL